MIKRLIKFATFRTGAFEMINLVITHIGRVSLLHIKTLMLQHSLDDGFNHINQKLVEFLREPEKAINDIVPTVDDRSYGSFAPTQSHSPSAPHGSTKAASIATRGSNRSTNRKDTFDTILTSSGLAKNSAATAKTKQTAASNNVQMTAL